MFVQLISKMKKEITASVITESVEDSEQKYCMKWEEYFDSESRVTNSIVLKKTQTYQWKTRQARSGAMNIHI